MKSELKLEYENVCRKYAKAFTERHGYDYSDGDWVGCEIGGILEMGDYSVDFATIQYDVDNLPHVNEFYYYYDYCQDAYNFGFAVPNYRSWCKGCPRVSGKKFEELKERRKQLDALIEETKKNIEI